MHRKVDPNVLGKDGWTALEIAAQTGVIENVEALIRDSRTKINTDSKRGSPLHLAAQAGDLKTCQVLLLADGSLILSRNEQGQTVMDMTTSNVVKNLLSKY